MGGSQERELSCRACLAAVKMAAPRTPCSRCGYVNLSLTDVRHPFPWLTAGRVGTPVDVLFADQLQQADALVAGDVLGASALLIQSMAAGDALRRAESAPRSLRVGSRSAAVNLGAQLLYLLLCKNGGVRLESVEDRLVTAEPGGILWDRILDAVRLAVLGLRASAQDSELRVVEGYITQTFSPHYLIELETQENSHLVENKFRDIASLNVPDFYNMQHAVLGFSFKQLEDLFAHNCAQLKQHATLKMIANVTVAKLGHTPEHVTKLLESLTLTLKRLQEFQFPYYFDLAPPRKNAGGPVLSIESVAMNWTAYYPLYQATAAGNGQAVLFTTHILVTALGYSLMSRSLMADLLVKRVDGIDTPEAAAVRRYRLSERFEQRIEDRLKAAKFATRAQLSDIPGAAFGPIDVVGARVRKKVTEIVVIEAKDFDMPLQKPGVFRQTLAELQKAVDRQLVPQTEWVKREWRHLLQLLGVEATKRVVMTPLLVTRRYVRPNLIRGGNVVPLRMLETVLSRLAHEKLEARDGLGPLPRIVLSA